MGPHCLNRDACVARKPDGHCRKCWGKHIRAELEKNTEALERQREGARQRIIAMNKNPSEAERKRRAETARKHAVLLRPEVVAKRNDPEVRARATANRVKRIMELPPEVRSRGARNAARAKMAWCPPELLSEYKFLRKKHIPAPEARQMIEAEIERREAMTQKERLNRMFRKAEAPARVEPRAHYSRVYTQTLGGVS